MNQRTLFCALGLAALVGLLVVSGREAPSSGRQPAVRKEARVISPISGQWMTVREAMAEQAMVDAIASAVVDQQEARR